MYKARRVEKGNGETCYPKKKRQETRDKRHKKQRQKKKKNKTKTTQEEELEEGQFSPSFFFSPKTRETTDNKPQCNAKVIPNTFSSSSSSSLAAAAARIMRIRYR